MSSRLLTSLLFVAGSRRLRSGHDHRRGGCGGTRRLCSKCSLDWPALLPCPLPWCLRWLQWRGCLSASCSERLQRVPPVPLSIVPWPCSSTYVAGTACEVADAVSTMHRPASASRAWWVSHWCTLRRRCPPVAATRRERLRRRCRVARWPQLMDCLAWQLGHVVCYPRQAAGPSASSICKQQAHATRLDRIGPYRAVNKLFTV